MESPLPRAATGPFVTFNTHERREVVGCYMHEVQAKSYRPFHVRNLRERLDPVRLMVAFAKLLWKWRRLASTLRVLQ